MISPEEQKVLRSFANRIPEDDPGAHNNLAIVYYNKGLYQEAIGELEKALQLNPNFVLARNNLEIILRKTGKLEERVEQLSRSIEEDPHDEKKILELADTYLRLNKHSHAIIYYKKVLDANPSSFDAHFGLGTTLKHLGKYDDALDEMNRVLDIKASHEVYRALGEIYLRKGVVDLAIKNFEEALKLNESSAETYFLLGFALGEKGRAQDSIEAVKKAIALNPSLAQGEASMPIDVEAHRDHWEFLKEQLGIPKTSGDSYKVHYNMAMSYFNKGLFDEAEREFHECLKSRKDDPELYYAIAEADIFLGKFDEAIHNLQRALQRDFDAVKYANALGVAYVMQGQFSNALEWFEKVLVQDEYDPLALNNVAVAQYNLGDTDLALENYKKSVEAGNADAHLNLAMHYLKSGDYDKALELLEHETADVHFARALVYMEKGDDEEALTLFKRVLELVPHHAGAYYNMGFIATRQGRYEESLSHIRKGMEIEPNYDNEKYHLSLDSALSEFGPYYVPKSQTVPTEVIDSVFTPSTVSVEELLGDAEKLLSSNDTQSALKKVDEALDIEPESLRAVVLKAEILHHHDDVDAAIDLLEGYNDKHAGMSQVLESLARMLKDKGRMKEARDKYADLSELQPDNLSWLNEVADLSYGLGDEDEALTRYLEIHEKDPKDAGVNLRLLRIYVNNKEYDRAKPFIEFFADSQQDSYEYAILAGIYWSEKGKYDRALEYFSNAVEIDSSQPLPYYHQGLLNVQRGSFEAACENWKKALLLSPDDDLANKIRRCLNLTIELSEILEREI